MYQVSFWEKEAYYAKADIIIVGGGFMGLWTAFEAKKQNPQLKIIILERNTTPLGASTRNAGFSCFGSPTELWKDYETMGENEMLTITEKRYKGIYKIKKHFTKNQLHYDACGGFECVKENDPELDDKLAWLNKSLKKITGKTNTFIVSNHKMSQLGLLNFETLIENKEEGSLHSGFFVKSLTKKVIELGVEILYGMNVTSWHSNKNEVEIICGEKAIKATALVVCTNAFMKEIISDIKVIPARGQVIVTSPIENLKLRGTFHADEGFYYWRNLGNRILLGGARNKAIKQEETCNFRTTEHIQQELEFFLKNHIAEKYDYNIAYRWSGIMAFSEDKKPVFSVIDNHVFAAMACNGMGVALTPIFAERVAQKVCELF